MNFLSNTDPPSIPDFYFKSKKQNQEKTTEKIKLYVNISHAYVAESVDKFFIVFTRCQIIAAVKLFSQVESLLISGGPFFNFGTAQPSFGATSKFNLIPCLTYFRIASKRTRNEATSLNIYCQGFKFEWLSLNLPTILFRMIRNIVDEYQQMHF